MVTTGRSSWDFSISTTEIMNLGPQEAPVPTYQNYPKKLSHGTGGWVGNQFIVCGGNVHEDITNECYKIGKENTTLLGNMKEKRQKTASIVLADKLWVLGGFYNGNFFPHMISFPALTQLLSNIINKSIVHVFVPITRSRASRHI